MLDSILFDFDLEGGLIILRQVTLITVHLWVGVILLLQYVVDHVALIQLER